MKQGYWVLDGHEPVEAADIHEWGRFFQSGARTVKRDDDIDGTCVSTVFLGMDHNWDDGPPLLFETMVFRGPMDERQWRYSTWDEAVAGHDRVAAAVREGRVLDD